MYKRLSTATLLVALACVAGFTAVPALAASNAPMVQADRQETFSSHPLEYLLGEGWETVAPGVLRREVGEGRTETYADGVRGLRWAVRHLQEELAVMKRDYDAAPSDELREAIETHRQVLVQTRARLHEATLEKSGGGNDVVERLVPGCDFNWGYWADAQPGAVASASAYWYNTCGYLANTYAYAYVSKTVGTVTTTKSQSDPKGPSTGISSYASASLSGSANSCYSYARSYVDSYNFGFFQATDTNYDCNPLAVSISGSTYVWVGSGCKTVTWFANPSGGSGSYTNYAWTYNGNAVGSNSSAYSRTFCAGSFYKYFTFTLGVTVTDSASATASDTHSVTVETEGSDPCVQPYSGSIGERALPCPEQPY